jgi:hypothetical protein
MSKYHEIKVLGKIWTQRVANINLVAHDGDIDKGRIVYSQHNDKLYYGTGTRWVRFNDKYAVIPQSTRLLFGRYPLPTGWNIIGSVDDYVLMLTSTEGDIGSTAGSWMITGIQSSGSHNHTGYLGPYTGGTEKVGDSDKYGSSAVQSHTHAILGTAGINDGLHFHTFDGNWRPYHDKYCIGEFA